MEIQIFKVYNSEDEMEKERILRALQYTPTERFYNLTRLIKIAMMLKKAKKRVPVSKTNEK